MDGPLLDFIIHIQITNELNSDWKKNPSLLLGIVNFVWKNPNAKVLAQFHEFDEIFILERERD